MPSLSNVRVIMTGIQMFRSYADPYTHWTASVAEFRKGFSIEGKSSGI